MFESLAKVWIWFKSFLSLEATSFLLSAIGGMAIYVLGWGSYRWFMKRVADPMAGSTLLGILGLRKLKSRIKRGTVTEVIDGDTIEIGGERIVKMIGVEAFKKGDSPHQVNPEKVKRRAEEAKIWLGTYVEGKRVELEIERGAGRREEINYSSEPTPAHVWTLDEEGQREVLLSEMIIWKKHGSPSGVSNKYQNRFERAYSGYSKNEVASQKESILDLERNARSCPDNLGKRFKLIRVGGSCHSDKPVEYKRPVPEGERKLLKEFIGRGGGINYYDRWVHGLWIDEETDEIIHQSFKYN